MRTHVPGGRAPQDRAHERSATVPGDHGLLRQSVISFAVSLAVTIIGIGYLHDLRWIRVPRARPAHVVTSSFTLARCIRDRRKRPPSLAGSTRPGWTSCWLSKTSSASRTADSWLQPGRHARQAARASGFRRNATYLTKPGQRHIMHNRAFATPVERCIISVASRCWDRREWLPKDDLAFVLLDAVAA